MATDEITVWVVKNGDDRNLLLQWIDPKTGRRRSKSAKTSNRKEAERLAVLKAEELRKNHGRVATDPTWDEFKAAYLRYMAEDAEVKRSTIAKTEATFAFIDRYKKPRRLSQITSIWIGHWLELLRETPIDRSFGAGKSSDRLRSTATIRGHLVTLRTALTWAAEDKHFLDEIPSFPKSKKRGRKLRGKVVGAKGRPLTGEEFDRMLAVVPDVVGNEVAADWVFFLRGLYLSGLRLDEALRLSWDQWSDTGFRVVEVGSEFLIEIDEDAQKNNEEQLLPLAADFVDFLASVPVEDRNGYVFNPRPQPLSQSPAAIERRAAYAARRNATDPNRVCLKRHERSTKDHASSTVRRIGKRANVITAKKDGRVHYATAHDLRRSFGLRWSRKVKAPQLMELMRHADIATTMTFYAKSRAEQTAAEIRAVYNAEMTTESADYTRPNTSPAEKPV